MNLVHLQFIETITEMVYVMFNMGKCFDLLLDPWMQLPLTLRCGE